MNFAAVAFDDGIKRVVSVKSVRDAATNKPFNPRAGDDFQEKSAYKVKWQKSMDEDDGFYQATVLCLAGSVDGAVRKAGILGHKMPENPLLDVSPSSDTSVEKGSRAERNKKDIKKDKLDHTHPKNKINHSRRRGHSSKGAVSTNDADADKKPSKKVEVKESRKGTAAEKHPKNKILSNSCVKERLKAALSAAKTHPLSREAAFDEERPDDPDPVVQNDDLIDGESPLQRADTLPVTPPPKKSSDFSSSSSDDDDDDKVSQLLEENLNLKRDVNVLQQDLVTTKASLKVSNETINRLKSDNAKYLSELETLQTSSKSKDDKISSLEATVNLLKKDLTPKSDKWIDSDFIATSSVLVSDTDESSPLKAGKSSPGTNPLTPQHNRKGNPTSPSTPSSSGKISPGGSSGSSRKRKGHKIDKDDLPIIKQVCERVLGHLQGTQLLKEDVNGKVDVGNGVLLPLKAMMTNFETNETDIPKITRNLTTLVWKKEDRVVRSLDGSASNRYPNASPKLAATPSKINTVIGCVQAHLKNLKTGDGAAMDLALKTCRKTIGLKFNEDCTLEKKKKK